MRDEHFRVDSLIQDEFRNLSEQFFSDVEKRVLGGGDVPPGFSNN